MKKDTKYICTKCGSEVKPVTRNRYPKSVRVFFIIIIIISFIACIGSIINMSSYGVDFDPMLPISISTLATVAIIDSLLYNIYIRRNSCPICDGEDTVIPANTPTGKKMIKSIAEPVSEETKNE